MVSDPSAAWVIQGGVPASTVPLFAALVLATRGPACCLWSEAADE